MWNCTDYRQFIQLSFEIPEEESINDLLRDSSGPMINRREIIESEVAVAKLKVLWNGWAIFQGDTGLDKQDIWHPPRSRLILVSV